MKPAPQELPETLMKMLDIYESSQKAIRMMQESDSGGEELLKTAVGFVALKGEPNMMVQFAKEDLGEDKRECYKKFLKMGRSARKNKITCIGTFMCVRLRPHLDINSLDIAYPLDEFSETEENVKDEEDKFQKGYLFCYYDLKTKEKLFGVISFEVKPETEGEDDNESEIYLYSSPLKEFRKMLNINDNPDPLIMMEGLIDGLEAEPFIEGESDEPEDSVSF
jgi:hypothetical protein